MTDKPKLVLKTGIYRLKPHINWDDSSHLENRTYKIFQDESGTLFCGCVSNRNDRFIGSGPNMEKEIDLVLNDLEFWFDLSDVRQLPWRDDFELYNEEERFHHRDWNSSTRNTINNFYVLHGAKISRNKLRDKIKNDIAKLEQKLISIETDDDYC